MTDSLLTKHFTDLYLGDPLGKTGESPYLWKQDGVVNSIPPTYHPLCEALYRKAVACGTDAFSLAQGGMQLRGQILRHTGGQTVVLRKLPRNIPRWGDLGLSSAILKIFLSGEASSLRLPSLLQTKSGMVVLCGETDSGKSTTLATLLKELLDLKPWMAITIEDPAELPIAGQHAQGFCYQQTVPGGGFAEALRAALRMNPDAILLGEIRDADTAATALSAAATGHLVLTTVHAASVPQAIRRLVDIGSRQNSFAYTPDYVASCLTCCIHQRLDRQSETAPPKAEGLSNRRLNATTLFTNDAVRTMIRTSRFERLQDEIESQRVRYGWGPEPVRRAV